MESKEVTVSEEDVMGLMDQFTRVPPLMLRIAVSNNTNAVKTFESRIIDYKDQLSEEEIAKIKKVLQMPTVDLQQILQNVYNKTGQKQLKILAAPKARPFIEKNLQELKKVLF